MYKHRNPDTITSEIHDTQTILMDVREALKTDPQEQSLHFILMQENRQVERLSIELEKALASQRKHVLKYAIDTNSTRVAIDTISELMAGFQDFITRAYQGIAGKGKTPLPLYLNTTYKGSFGLLLNTDTDDNLMYSYYSETLEFVFSSIEEMAKCHDKKQIHDFLETTFKNDQKLIGRFKEFYHSISKSGNGIKLEWISHYVNSQQPQKVKVSYEQAKFYYETLHVKDSEDPEPVEYTGDLKGVNLLSREMELLINESTSIKAKFKKIHDREIESNFNQHCTIRFNKITKYNHATDVETIEHKFESFVTEEYCQSIDEEQVQTKDTKK